MPARNSIIVSRLKGKKGLLISGQKRGERSKKPWTIYWLHLFIFLQKKNNVLNTNKVSRYHKFYEKGRLKVI